MVLEALIALAGHQVDVQALEAQRHALEVEVAELAVQAREEAARLERLRTETLMLQQELAQGREAKARLDEECERQAGGLAVVRALHGFLLGKTAEAEALWTTLEGLFVWRRNGGRLDGSMGTLFTDGVKQKMLTFFQQLIRDAVTK
jgi:DNA-binding FadR family transcriptional regulator